MLLLVPVGIEIGFVEEDAKLAIGVSKFAIVSFLGNPTAGKIGKVILKQYVKKRCGVRYGYIP
jgi:hypothetical protein